MLYLDNPIGAMHGLMVYRDHANPRLFYYMSERPRISKTAQGRPEMSLIKYKRDLTDNPAFDPTQTKSLGGGLFTFTVDLGVDASVLSAVRSELSRRVSGEINLSPIQFRGGTVRLSTTKKATEEEGGGASSGFAFFEEVLGATVPTLLGDNRAVFSIVLTQEGATLIEEALKTGISPVGVIYELNTLAMRPAFHVKVVAEYSRIYEHFELEMGIRSRVGRTAMAAEINDAWQKLVELGAIRIEVLQFTDDDDLKKQAADALAWFQTELLKDFFKSNLQPPSFMARGSGQGMLAQLGTLFGALQSGQAGASSTPRLGDPAPQGQSAPPPTTQRDGVTSTSQVNQSAQTQTQGQGDELQVAFSLKHYRQEELKRREMDYSMQTAVSWDFGAQGMFDTITRGLDPQRVIAEIDLDDEFFDRILVDVAVVDDMAAVGVSALTVNMEYPGEATGSGEPEHRDGWSFQPGQVPPRQFMCSLNARKDLSYRYRVDVSFGPGAPWEGSAATVHSGWVVSRARQLTVNALDHLSLLEVRVVPGRLRAELVEQVQVELRYEGAGQPLSETWLLKPGAEERSWKIRLNAEDPRSFSYKLTYNLAGGARLSADWVRTDTPTVVVDDPFQGSLKLRLIPMLDASELIEAMVELRYTDPTTGFTLRKQHIFNPSAMSPVSVEIPTLAASPGAYAYDITVVRTDGQVLTSAVDNAEGPAVLVTDGRGALRAVTVRLLDAGLGSAGLVAVRVALTGPGSSPETDEVLFTPSQVEDRRVSVVVPQGTPSFSYRYKVTGYTASGVEIAGASGQTDQGVLLVALPR